MEKEKEDIKKNPLTTGGMIVVVAAIVCFVMGIIWGALIGAGIFALIAFLVLYLVWAPHGIFGFFLEEGYAKILMKGDSFHKCYIKYQGRVLLSNFDVVDGEENVPFNIMGVVPIFWPFYRVYTYQQKWVKFKNGEKVERKEPLSHVILMPYVYGVEIKDAETEGKVPINLWIEVEAVIFNPYKAMFQIKDWNAAMTSWIEGASRDFVSKNFYEEIIRGELSNSLKDHIVDKVEVIIERYGVKITNLSVIQVVPSNAEYEQVTQQKVVEERKMEATLVRARADAQKEAIARMGSALSMVASATGQTVEKLQQELETNPEALNTKYKKQFKVAMDLVNKNMAIDGKAYFEMKIPKGSGTGGGGADYSNMIGAIIAANKIIEQQKTSPPASSSSSTKEEKKKIYSREEIDSLIAEADKNRSRK